MPRCLAGTLWDLCCVSRSSLHPIRIVAKVLGKICPSFSGWIGGFVIRWSTGNHGRGRSVQCRMCKVTSRTLLVSEERLCTLDLCLQAYYRAQLCVS
nr:hypothetical protein Iba_chr11eCG1290 [Ipomoea batatas]